MNKKRYKSEMCPPFTFLCMLVIFAQVTSVLLDVLFLLQVRTWKKNLLRTFLVLTTAGLAVTLKNDFAYVSAIVGSIGSSTLGFILPCVFHLVLCKGSMTKLSLVKDILFITFGIIGGVTGVLVTVQQLIEQFS